MNEKITYSDFLEQVALKGEVSQDLVHNLLAATIHLVEEGLNESGQAVIQGLGRFQLQWHEAREGRNPQTGESVVIPAHSSVRFKPDANLRRFINRKYANLKPKFLKEKQSAIVADEPLIEEAYNIPDPIEQTVDRERNTFGRTRSSWRWWWLVIPLLIIILAFLIWPESKSDLSELQKSQKIENTTHEVANVSENEQTEKSAIEKSITEKQKSIVPLKKNTPGGMHQVQAGDNLWRIANEFYDSAYLWPLIYHANLNRIKTPDQVSPGVRLTVPALEGDKKQLTSKDKTRIAEGFVHAYLYYKDSQPAQAREYLWVAQKWDQDSVLEKYMNQIQESDLERVRQIIGKVQL